MTSYPKQHGKVRVGINGCGSVSNMYLPHLAQSPYVELVAACDIVADRAAEAAATYGIPHQYTDVRTMLDGCAFDLFVNLSNMQEHGRTNTLAIEAGRHVWSEKPLANTYPEGAALLKLAQTRGVRIWGAPAVISSPQFAFMAQAIAEGRLGRVAAAHAYYGHTGPEWSSFWYEQGGGSLPDLGVYSLSTLTGLLGPVKELVAMTTIVTPERDTPNRGRVTVEVEDNAMLIMHHGHGVLSHIMCGYNYFDPHGHEGTGQERPTVTIMGSKGHMHLVGYDWKPFGVDMATEDHPETRRYCPDADGFVWEQGASLVAECLVTGRETRITAEHSLHVLEIMDAAREAQRTGRRIAVQSTFRWPLVAVGAA